MVALVGVTSMCVIVGGGVLTLSVAGLLVTLRVPSVALALISTVPALRPVTLAVAMPVFGSVVTESTVAMLVSLEVNVMMMPLSALPF